MPIRRDVTRRTRKMGWGLWRVIVPGAGPCGYMVTSMGRIAHPLTFVFGTSPKNFATARRIHLAAGERKPRRDAWRQWVGFLFIPVDRRGRRINQGFVSSAHFTPDGMFAESVAPDVTEEIIAGNGEWPGGAPVGGC